MQKYKAQRLSYWALPLLLFLAFAFSHVPALSQGTPPPRGARLRPKLVLQVGHRGPLVAVVFSPDGKRLATSGQDNTVKLWNVETGEVQHTIMAGTWVHSLAFSPDGTTLAGDVDGEINLWDVRTGESQRTLKTNLSEYGIWSVAFSRDGKMLASGGGISPKVQPGVIALWNARSGLLQHTLRGHDDSVQSVAFSPDGKTLASASRTELKLWDTHSGKLQRALISRDPAVALPGSEYGGYDVHVAFSADGERLASGNGDTVKLWDVRTGQLQRTLKISLPASNASASSASSPPIPGSPGSPDSRVILVAFSLDGKALFIGDSATIDRWDLSTGKLQKWTVGGYPFLVGLPLAALSPDGKTLALGGRGEAQNIGLLDMETKELRLTLRGPPSSAWERVAVTFSPDGETLADSSDALRLWNVHTGALQRNLGSTLLDQSYNQKTIVFSPDGKTLASVDGTYGEKISLYDMQTGQLKRIIAFRDQPATTGIPRPVCSLAFSPDSKSLASATGAPTWLNAKGADEVKLWDVATGELQRTLTLSADPVDSVGFLWDSKTRVTVYLHHPGSNVTPDTISVWDVRAGVSQRTLKLGEHVEGEVCFSPDGKTLARGDWSEMGTVGLWDLGTGKLQRTLKLHARPSYQGLPFSMVFSPDGKTLSVGKVDGTLDLWDVGTGKLSKTLTDEAAVQAIAFSPDGKTLANERNGHTMLWDVPSGRLLASLLPLPQVAEKVQGDARGLITVGVKATAAETKAAETKAADNKDEWFVITPEGYFDCSANAARLIQWNVNGELYPAERYIRRLRRPDLVQRALRREKIGAPGITNEDITPAAQFAGLKNGAPAPTDPLTVTIEVSDDRDVKEVELLVNGRPLPPEQARPITVDSRPITVEARPIIAESRTLDPNHRITKSFTFSVPLPTGAPEIHLRAIAYDNSDLGSDPVEIVLQRAGAQPVAGKLYVLSAGVSRYKNADGQRLKNLQFPAMDAKAIAARFQREGQPLYEGVRVRTLTDEQATATNIRAGLKWLQESARPGQIDTVVIFLSGHGVSDAKGHYYFATHEIDVSNVTGTSLSGAELRAALGGQLRAKSVFLFVDTCHAGGLSGRNDDLALQVGEGVFLLASSGPSEYSYESKEWEHGAFTLALLRALDKKELAADGLIRFNALTFAVPNEVADLMKAAGRSESEQQPVVPLAARRLRVPIAQAR